jgi:hypothetical protein
MELSKLYKLVNGIGTYWVIAKDPTDAETKLMALLDAGSGYGYSSNRKVTEIYLIAEEIYSPPTGLSGRFLVL